MSHLKKIKSLSIFFPSLNDAKVLPYLISKAYVTAKKITNDFEIIIINDGSTDDTPEVLKHLKKMYTELKIIVHTKNRGYGASLIDGFKNSSKEWVFYTDGDAQYNPEQLLFLVKKMNEKTDVVNGYKLKRGDSFTRTYVGKIYNYLLHFFYSIPIKDVDCDFRLMRASFVKNISLSSHSGLICLELILKLKDKGAVFREVGVGHEKRIIGKSEFFKLSHLLKTLEEHLLFYKEYNRNRRISFMRAFRRVIKI